MRGDNLARVAEPESEAKGWTLTQPQSDFFHLNCKYPAFIGGYGSGKTQAMIARAMQDKMIYPQGTVALYEPTYDLARLILAPRIEELLEVASVKYNYNKSENVIYLFGYGKFIIRTLDKPSRIVGYEAFRSHVDEIDTLKKKHAREAWNKILARNRQRCPDRQYGNRVAVYTTPEGFNFVYERWKKNPTSQHRYIVAPTYTNPHLPEDYEKDLRAQYDSQRVASYIEGQFVNLTTGSVYYSFSRKLNHTDTQALNNEPLKIGMDFNVGRGCAVVHVLRNGMPCAVDEIYNSFDTPDTIRVLKARYPKNLITIYPDASGKSRKSQGARATESDIALLKQAGFNVKHITSNPSIKDRVAAMNGMLHNDANERRYKVNTNTCPRYTEALEQQAYDENGLPTKGEGMGDDINDSAGYYIANEFPIYRKIMGAIHLIGA